MFEHCSSIFIWVLVWYTCVCLINVNSCVFMFSGVRNLMQSINYAILNFNYGRNQCESNSSLCLWILLVDCACLQWCLSAVVKSPGASIMIFFSNVHGTRGADWFGPNHAHYYILMFDVLQKSRAVENVARCNSLQTFVIRTFQCIATKPYWLRWTCYVSGASFYWFCFDFM